MDGFAKSSFLFEQCYSQSPWTKPSVASMLTGFVPSVHQAVIAAQTNSAKGVNVQVLLDRFVTLPERFKDAGYRTALFMVNSHCQREFGFAQGMDTYDFMNFNDPAEQIARVESWLAEHSNEPFFIYIHVRDPHMPYENGLERCADFFGEFPAPPQRDLDLMRAEGQMLARAASGKTAAIPGSKLKDLSPEGVEHMRRCYDSEIFYVDHQFASLMKQLDTLGIRSKTIVAITADHGEAFREHGNIGHAYSLFDEEIHVPLIIHVPGMTQCFRVPWTVSMFDIYPSLLTLCGIVPTDGIQAQSLFLDDGRLAVSTDRLLYAELDLNNPATHEWTVGAIKGPLKLIYDRKADSSAVYNRAKDSAEQRPGKETDKPEFKELRQCLDAVMTENARLADMFGPPEWSNYDKKTEENLKALGYL